MSDYSDGTATVDHMPGQVALTVTTQDPDDPDTETVIEATMTPDAAVRLAGELTGAARAAR